MRQRYSSSVAVPLSHSTVPLTHSVLSQQLPVAGRSQTLTGQKGMVECQRRGNMVAVLLQLWLVVVDVVVTCKAIRCSGCQGNFVDCHRAERSTRMRFRKCVTGHAAWRFVPFAVETCGHMEKQALQRREPLWGQLRVAMAAFPIVNLCAGQCSCCG